MTFKKSIFATLGLTIYSFIIGFFNSIISTRLLGAEGKGIFAIYTSSIELMALVLGLGIPQALIFFASKNTISRERLLYSCFLYMAVATLLFWGLVRGSAWFGFQSFFLPEPFTSSIYEIVIALNFLCLLGWYLFVSIINGHKFFLQTNFISFLNISLTFIVYLILFSLTYYLLDIQLKANTFYFIQLGGAAFTLLLSVYFHIKLIGGAKKPAIVSASEGSAIIKYGLVYFLSNFLLFANTKMDYWFINYFSGSYELGIYVLSSNVGLLMLLLPNAIGLVLSAFKAKSELDDIESRTAFLCRITFLLTFSVACFLWIFGETIIVLLYGEEFRESAIPLKIILLGVIPFSVFTILKNYFAGADNLKAFLMASFAGFILTFTLDVLLIKPYGIMGASVATCASYILSSIYLIFVFSKRTSISMKNILLFNRNDFHIVKQVVVDLIARK